MECSMEGIHFWLVSMELTWSVPFSRSDDWQGECGVSEAGFWGAMEASWKAKGGKKGNISSSSAYGRCILSGGGAYFCPYLSFGNLFWIHLLLWLVEMNTLYIWFIFSCVCMLSWGKLFFCTPQVRCITLWKISFKIWSLVSDALRVNCKIASLAQGLLGHSAIFLSQYQCIYSQCLSTGLF